MNKNPLNTRQQVFVRELVRGGTQVSAYQKAYPTASYDTARSGSSELLAKPSIQLSLDQQLKDGAQHAYDVLMSLLDDPLTPANVRKDIAKDMVDRGHGTVTQKTEVKDTTEFKGISDLTKADLKAML